MGYGPVVQWSRPVPVWVGQINDPTVRAEPRKVESLEFDVQVRVVGGTRVVVGVLAGAVCGTSSRAWATSPLSSWTWP